MKNSINASITIYGLTCFVCLIGQLFSQTDIEKMCFDEINRVRVGRGLPELQFDETAYQHAKHSVEVQFKRNQLGHFTGSVGAEICALNGQMTENPKIAVRQWLNSKKGHREVMLSKNYTYIGVAHAGKFMAAQLMSNRSRTVVREEVRENNVRSKYKTVTKTVKGRFGILSRKVTTKVLIETESEETENE